jgi:hypothetical protein
MSARAIASLVVAVVVATVLLIAPVHADIFESIPVNDRDGASTTGVAGPYILRDDGGGALIFGSGFSGGIWRTGMEFDILGTFPQVQQAQLSLRFEVVSNPPAGYVVHGYVGDGTVTSADLLTNNPLTPVLTAPSGPYAVIDVTAYVQQLVTNHQRYAGFMFSGFPGGSGAAIRSSEPFVEAPKLTITAVPEPASTLIAGVVTLLVLARPRHNRALS